MRAAREAATALGAFSRVSHPNHSESGGFCQVGKLSEVSRPVFKVIIMAGKVWHMPIAVGIESAQGGEGFGDDVGNHGGNRGRLVNDRPDRAGESRKCDGGGSGFPQVVENLGKIFPILPP